jgi:hypothetical protein
VRAGLPTSGHSIIGKQQESKHPIEQRRREVDFAYDTAGLTEHSGPRKDELSCDEHERGHKPDRKSPIVFGRPSRTWLTQANEAVSASRMAIMSKSENIPDHSPVRVVTTRMQFPARLGCTRCPPASRSSSRAALARHGLYAVALRNDAAKDRMQPSRRS